MRYFPDADNLRRADIKRATDLNVARMKFSAGWSSVSTFDIPPEIEDGDWRFDCVVSPCRPVERRLLQGHQTLGYGSPVTYDAAYEAVRRSQGSKSKLDERGKLAKVSFEETQEWVLLFQLDSDDELNTMWGDVGTLFFMIRKTDLAARDFDKVWMELQFT